jgi:hypothetical protein
VATRVVYVVWWGFDLSSVIYMCVYCDRTGPCGQKSDVEEWYAFLDRWGPGYLTLRLLSFQHITKAKDAVTADRRQTT